MTDLELEVAESAERRRLQAMSAEELILELRGLDQAIKTLMMKRGHILHLLEEFVP